MVTNTSLHLEQIPKELTLILALLHTDFETSEQKNEELFEAIDWNLFLELTLHHRVFPMLYPVLKKVESGLIPVFVMQQLAHLYKRNTFQMLHLSAEMEAVHQLFTDNDIRLLFLKGPVLAESLYGDISLRTSSDLDFLIPIEQLSEAEQLVTNLGYVKDDYIETILNDWRWRHHHVTYFHPNKGIKLEIHWRLHPGPGREQSFEQLWSRKATSSLTSSSIYLLGKEDLFLFLACHGARHGWSRLRWLVDIRQLLLQPLDWKKVCNLLKTYHCTKIGSQAIILAAELLQTNVVEELRGLARRQDGRDLAQEAIFYLEQMVNLHTDPVPAEVSKYHERHLFSLMSLPQKCVFLLSFLFPYPEDAEILPLPKQLHFLYFPLRPFLWAWRKTKKHAIS